MKGKIYRSIHNVQYRKYLLWRVLDQDDDVILWEALALEDMSNCSGSRLRAAVVTHLHVFQHQHRLGIIKDGAIELHDVAVEADTLQYASLLP